MHRSHTRFIGAMAALLAAGLAGFTLRPPQRSVTPLAARNPAAEVRTEVIRRTIHIVRHEHARQTPRPPSRVYLAAAGGSAVARPVRTGASASHAAGTAAGRGAAGAAPVTTRASASRAGSSGSSSGSSASGAKPITTRTSTSHGTTGGSKASSGTVTTRTSRGKSGGDGGDNGGGGSNGD